VSMGQREAASRIAHEFRTRCRYMIEQHQGSAAVLTDDALLGSSRIPIRRKMRRDARLAPGLPLSRNDPPSNSNW